MSRLIRLAKQQRSRANIARYTALELKCEWTKPRKISSILRRLPREVGGVRDLELEMYEEINARQSDIDDLAAFDLMMVVSNLTNFRINRLAYAGRVLP